MQLHLPFRLLLLASVAILVGCQTASEVPLGTLTEKKRARIDSLCQNWIESETTLVGRSTLAIRYRRLLAHIRVNNPPEYRKTSEGWRFVDADSVEQKPKKIRVVRTPLLVDEGTPMPPMHNYMFNQWLEEVYPKAVEAESAGTTAPFAETHPKNPHVTRLSDAAAHVYSNAAAAEDSVREWRRKTEPVLEPLVTDVLEGLPREDDPDHIAVFEIATGRRVTVHYMPLRQTEGVRPRTSRNEDPELVLQYGGWPVTSITAFFDRNDEITSTSFVETQ